MVSKAFDEVRKNRAFDANQTPSLTDGDRYAETPLLGRGVDVSDKRIATSLHQHGEWCASAQANDLARMANENVPVLRTHDASGSRLDVVEYHPAYHSLMRTSAGAGLNASIWEDNEGERGQRNHLRAVRFIMSSGTEAGHLCPMTMTNASVAALATTPELMDRWWPRVVSRDYDPRLMSAAGKSAATIGMGMTERQGGTDVRRNRCWAERTGDGWRLHGEKWFLSAPMSDAFLVLAQTEGGLSCFLVPRVTEDGRMNAIHLRRLKDKLGNRSNASAEVEFRGALADLVGEEGSGVRTIIEMVTLTRLDCASGSAGLALAALQEAVHHARHRNVSGGVLVDQPIMMRVLADLALDVAGFVLLAKRLAAAYDEAGTDDAQAAYARLMTPVTKYFVCKAAPPLIGEAMECLGGNGYVEASRLPRLYREAPVNAIWEGSGNVMGLDLVRVVSRSPELIEPVVRDIAEAHGGGGQRLFDVLVSALRGVAGEPGAARVVMEQLAIAAAAGELRKHAPELADAYVETRFAGPWRATYGMLDARHDCAALIDMMAPPTG